jgi:PhnB protein
MRVEPYLYFGGRCQEAVDFYRGAVGAEVVALTRFADAPGVPAPPGAGDKVMHAILRIGATTVLASDGSGGEPGFKGFSLSLSVPEEAEADRLFAALAEGGQVQMAPHRTPFAARFGMLVDRFGVHWTIAAGT